jgi:hypothetical protein
MGISITVFNLLQVHLSMEGVYEQVDLTGMSRIHTTTNEHYGT